MPRDENDWLKAEQLAAIVRDLADGCETLYLQPDDLAAVLGETQTKHGIGTEVLTTSIDVAGKVLPAGTRVLGIDRGTASGDESASNKGRGAGPADRGTAPSRGTGAAARGTAPSRTASASKPVPAGICQGLGTSCPTVRVQYPGWRAMPLSPFRHSFAA